MAYQILYIHSHVAYSRKNQQKGMHSVPVLMNFTPEKKIAYSIALIVAAINRFYNFKLSQFKQDEKSLGMLLSSSQYLEQGYDVQYSL